MQYFAFDHSFTFLNVFVSFCYWNNSISMLYYRRTCIIVDIPTPEIAIANTCSVTWALPLPPKEQIWILLRLELKSASKQMMFFNGSLHELRHKTRCNFCNRVYFFKLNFKQNLKNLNFFQYEIGYDEIILSFQISAIYIHFFDVPTLKIEILQISRGLPITKQLFKQIVLNFAKQI